jgi:L-ascorbate metabolism protein UlaG (beta-lactamase superfamily)
VKLEEFSQKGERAGSVSVGQADAGKNGEIKATIGALPCQHISARTPFDKAKTLWASWSVESGGAKVYFAGYVSFVYCIGRLPMLTFPQRHRLPHSSV